MPRPTLVARNDHTIRDALSDFLLAHTSALRSPRTVAYCDETLRPSLAFLEAEDVTDSSLLEVRHVRAHLAERAERVAPPTAHASARAIRAWDRFLGTDGSTADASKRPLESSAIIKRLPKERALRGGCLRAIYSGHGY